jgi:outer membrane murein-binding lipoprotein Lpp
MSDLPNDITPEGAFPPERKRKQHKRNSPVFTYLILLFLAALLLLAMSYFMQQRKLEGMDESIAGLKESVSAMQGIESIQEENTQLRTQVEELQAQVDSLTKERDSLAEQNQEVQDDLTQSENQSVALNWLLEIQEMYDKQYYRYARPLIQEFEAYGLAQYLPTEPIQSKEVSDLTFESPAETYARIVEALYPDGVPELEGEYDELTGAGHSA